MELRHLRYFIAVAEELHFTRAAERLRIAQPPLSQQIQALEREVGAPLLRRTKRSVELTEAGRVFLEEARRAVAQAEQAVASAQRAARGEIGRIALGFVGSATYNVLPQVLRSFRRRYPAVVIALRELTTAQQLAALDAHEIDVALVRKPPPRDPLATRILVEEDFVVALPRQHRLARRAEVPFGDLAEDSFILFPRPQAASLYDAVVSACQRAGFTPNIVQETTQIPVMISLVAAGLGIAIVPSGVRALKWRNVIYRPLAEPRPSTNIVIAWRKDASAVVRAFVSNAVSDRGNWK